MLLSFAWVCETQSCRVAAGEIACLHPGTHPVEKMTGLLKIFFRKRCGRAAALVGSPATYYVVVRDFSAHCPLRIRIWNQYVTSVGSGQI
jgi:hypothetical protein